MAASCAAKDDPDSVWPHFCPSKAAAYLYAILFGLTLLAHIVQAIIYRKGYSWVIAMGALWEVGCYIFRIQSINQPTKESWYTAWFVLILLAPLWINAYVYMALGRMVYNFTASARILRVKAWRFGLLFVLLDIFAFVVQAVGAVMASGSNISQSQVYRGLHIYMGGVGLQQFFVICFTFLAYSFQKEMKRDLVRAEQPQVLRLLYVLYAVLALITIRIVFRLVEYAQGIDSGIPQHEAYQYVFDSSMMLLACVLLNIIHPGRVMPGKESDFPSRKQRKAVGKNNIRGRAGVAGSLPLDETARPNSPHEPAGLNPTYPEIDKNSWTRGTVTEYER